MSEAHNLILRAVQKSAVVTQNPPGAEVLPPDAMDEIRAVEQTIVKINRFLRALWMFFPASVALTLVLLLRGSLKLADIGGFFQGTVGIVVTIISILYLVVSIKGTEKQIILATVESKRQFRETEERESRDRVQREKACLDAMLDARLALLNYLRTADVSDSGSMAHVSHLLRRSKSYLSSARQREEISQAAGRDLGALLREDVYIVHLRLIFEVAQQSDVKQIQELIDHVWRSLTIDERALTAVLMLCDFEVPKPSRETLTSWKVATEAVLPWNRRLLSLDELMQ